VLTRHRIIKLHVLCANMIGNVDRVNMDIRVLILLLFIFTKFDECQATVQRVITSQKSKKKQANFRV
jgi:hypothetical protein